MDEIFELIMAGVLAIPVGLVFIWILQQLGVA